MDFDTPANLEQGLVAQRPGCVTAYVLLLWLAAAIPLLVVAWFFIADPLGSAMVDGAIIFFDTFMLPFFIAALPALLAVATGIGLWLMKRWGVWLLSILLAFVAILGFVALQILSFGGFLRASTTLICLVVGLLANGLVLYWYVKNRFLFNGAPEVDRSGFPQD